MNRDKPGSVERSKRAEEDLAGIVRRLLVLVREQHSTTSAGRWVACLAIKVFHPNCARFPSFPLACAPRVRKRVKPRRRRALNRRAWRRPSASQGRATSGTVSARQDRPRVLERLRADREWWLAPPEAAR